jgi:hypothetical protein
MGGWGGACRGLVRGLFRGETAEVEAVELWGGDGSSSEEERTTPS